MPKSDNYVKIWTCCLCDYPLNQFSFCIGEDALGNTCYHEPCSVCTVDKTISHRDDASTIGIEDYDYIRARPAEFTQTPITQTVKQQASVLPAGVAAVRDTTTIRGDDKSENQAPAKSPQNSITATKTYEPSIGPSHSLTLGAATLPDSGYGSASQITANAYQYQAPAASQVKLPEADSVLTDDVASILTEMLPLDLSEDLVSTYVGIFARRLLHSTGIQDLECFPEIDQTLPRLLRAFALRVAFADSSADRKAVATFARQNKLRITKAFMAAGKFLRDAAQDKNSERGSGTEEETPSQQNGNSVADKQMKDQMIAHWLVSQPLLDLATDQLELDDAAINEGPWEVEDEWVELSDSELARIDFTVNTTTYSWLTAAVQRTIRLDYSNSYVLSAVQTFVSSVLPQASGSRALRPQSLRVKLFWDPQAFINEQGYDGASSLLTAVTISGSKDSPQLLPCLQYVKQTWPLIGEPIMDAIVAAAAKPPGTAIKSVLFDNTEITLSINNGAVAVECVGLFDSILEATEVLVWAGTALREASDQNSIRYSVMNMSRAHSPKGSSIVVRFSEEDLSTENGPGFATGDCWQGLVKNPVIAKGFPVPFRPKGIPGLDIPLEAMGLLVGAPCVTAFQNRAVMKGFNAAIVPIAESGSIIHWHLVLNKDGSRLPYSDSRILSSMHMDLPAALPRIQAARHILGWTPMVSYNVGSPLANYKIGWSSPDFVGPGCSLEKIVISGGPGFLSAGAEFSLGRKDRALVNSHGIAYFDMLTSLSSSYVVLYDVQDHRAWLSNGTHALLHVRASLQHDKDSDFAANCLYDPLKLEEAPNPSHPSAASNFLKSPHNWEQPLYPNPDELRSEKATTPGGDTITTEYRSSTGVFLKDRINQIMHTLEQLIDYQAISDSLSTGVPIKMRPRSRLEGYRFMDIAARKSITPRVVSLSVFTGAGKSWIDFTRAIKAVTLFGEGFGELLGVPQDTIASVCSLWHTLPKNKDYLAASEYDLSKILHQEGSSACSPLKLAPGNFWHRSTTVFGPCTCRQGEPVEMFGMRVPKLRRACDRVQIILPSQNLPKGLRGKHHSPAATIGTEGAVIFGRSELLPWKWPDQGAPKRDVERISKTDDEESAGSRLASDTSYLSAQDSVTSATAASTLPSTTTSLDGNECERDVGANGSTPAGKTLVGIGIKATEMSGSQVKRQRVWDTAKNVTSTK
ncbi:hypothetical protein B0T26DRAFT_488346 [Lasiosphaeria miniovina]|uniref:Uncharacterized protein n=1 Tax=Lasiosphaeria miniovina TaxID=1954250 RepID=A0AA40DIX3_9PEZI|nr:uncharacterized protein B0T26DRAFT_488346 [Lasiosphaeria miniovina]KAK0703026.1 hypothetical protein B0T26DRAFT_488346 [Lasiosphaeria miniovina]